MLISCYIHLVYTILLPNGCANLSETVQIHCHTFSKYYHLYVFQKSFDTNPNSWFSECDVAIAVCFYFMCHTQHLSPRGNLTVTNSILNRIAASEMPWWLALFPLSKKVMGLMPIWFFPCLCGFSPDAPASSYSNKDMQSIALGQLVIPKKLILFI